MNTFLSKRLSNNNMNTSRGFPYSSFKFDKNVFLFNSSAVDGLVVKRGMCSTEVILGSILCFRLFHLCTLSFAWGFSYLI